MTRRCVWLLMRYLGAFALDVLLGSPRLKAFRSQALANDHDRSIVFPPRRPTLMNPSIQRAKDQTTSHQLARDFRADLLQTAKHLIVL